MNSGGGGVGKDSAQRVVSAAEITRNFGMWQDLAGQGPIVVTHHGRARCVLVSADTFERMSQQTGGNQIAVHHAAIEHGLLAERIDSGFAVFNADMELREVNSLGAMILDQPREVLLGLPLGEILPELANGIADMQLRRTLRTGEAVRLVVPMRAGSLHVHAFPWPDGIAITLRRTNEEEELEQTSAEIAAIRKALTAYGGIGTARISVRGTLSMADRGLAEVTGVAIDRLAGARLIDLFTRRSRISVGEALESVLLESRAVALDATLLADGGSELSVRVALAPLADGWGVGGAMLMVETQHDGGHA
jgi:PHD/YefM family antitoxin component YafN of YafNO toxin-antitoxin module